MPRGDRTGPAGAGPMTGRGAGICAGTNAPGTGVGRGGLGRRMRMGCGSRNRGFSDWGNATQVPAEPLKKTEQLSALKEQMRRLQQKIEVLENAE